MKYILKKINCIFCITIFFVLFNIFNTFASDTYHCSTCNKDYLAKECKQKLIRVGVYGLFCPVHTSELLYEWQANDNTARPKTDVMTDGEILTSYSDIRGMITDICSVGDQNISENSIFNTDNMMIKIFDSCIDAINKWTTTSLYYMFMGLGAFILTFNFAFMIQNTTIGTERRSIEQMLKMMFQYILGLFIVLNTTKILLFLLGISKYILVNVISFKTNSATTFAGDSINNFALQDKLTITLIREKNLDFKGTLDRAFSMVDAAILKITLIIPWVVSQISKFIILGAILKNSIEIIAYGMFYAIPAGDCIENIKHSNFMNYTKHIFGVMLQQAVIVVILFASNLLLNGFINQLFEEASNNNTESTTKIFTFFIILCFMQLSRTIAVTTSSSIIASKVTGG